ncbi:hypothetical protein N9N28_14970 [Rubripirellula amarantea]|nr:hypothetical protein [Rubripirellula amarantea]
MWGQWGDDSAEGGDGNDLIYGNEGNDKLRGNSGDDKLLGGDGDDKLNGDDGSDKLYGDAGADLLFGGADDDVLEGGDGNDLLSGDAGDDTIWGQLGNDSAEGGDGNDVIYGNEGDDSLKGGDGNDKLYGGDGDEVIFGGGGDDQLLGEVGNDALIGGAGSDHLMGGDGNDLLVGGAEADTLIGLEGQDILIGATTVFDDDASQLRRLVTTWNSNLSYEQRTAKLSAQSAGSVHLGIQTTVFDDGFRDILTGGTDEDWLFLTSVNATYDPVGTSHSSHSEAGSEHHSGANVVVHTPPIVEGFALIDSIDKIADLTEGELVTQRLPHATNPVKASEHLQLFQLVRYADITHTAVASGDWSDPAIWQDGHVPGQNARVLIPINTHVSIDTQVAADIFSVRVDGTLSFDTTQDTELRVDTLVVTAMGKFEMGSTDAPIQSGVSAQLVFTNNGEIDRAWDPFGLSRGLISHGSVNMHGEEKTSFVEVVGSLAAGERFISLSSVPTNWNVGDNLVIAGTTGNGLQDEERQLLAVNGNVIEVAPLEYNHTSPSTSMQFHVANLTRNAVITSEGESSTDRGHVMFMHNRNVNVSYTGFHGLGRTDKSIPINDAEVSSTWELNPGSGTNPRARYSVHFHRNGILADGSPSVVSGSVVTDGGGWGFVNHSSYVDVVNNVAYDVLGAGFVAEAGDEIGRFDGNLAVHFQGSGEEAESRSYRRDFGHDGVGFWLQSPGLEVVNNVVAGAGGAAYTYYMRGLKESDGEFTEFVSANLLDPTIAAGAETIALNKVPIRTFENNVAYASTSGMDAFYVLEASDHGTPSVISDSTFWNNDRGIYAPYSKHLEIQGVTITHDASALPTFGFEHNALTRDIKFTDITIVGYRYGIWATQTGLTNIRSGLLANKTNIWVTPARSPERQVTVSPDVNLLSYPDAANSL